MEGGTLLAAWRSFRETLPEQVRNSGVVRLAFAAGASWATERMTDQREKVRHDALVMIGKADADMPANAKAVGLADALSGQSHTSDGLCVAVDTEKET